MAGRAQAPSDTPSRPLATVVAEHGGQRIAAADRAAAGSGVVPGLPLADARAILPGLRTAGADPLGDRRALAALAGWCGRYTPWTAADDSAIGAGNGVWLEIGGCAHLFGGEAALLADLGRRLDRLGYENAAAVADTPGAAWAVARFTARSAARGAARGAAPSAVIVPPAAQQRAIAALPMAALRLPGSTVEGLRRMGLKRVGDLIGLPRAPLTARFGPAPVRRLDQALGRLDESINPRHPTPALRTRLAFAEPIGRRDDIDEAVRRLLAALCERLAEARRGARRLRLACYRTDGTIFEATVGTSRPVRDIAYLDRLFRNKLDDLDAGFGIEAMALAAEAADPLPLAQAELTGGDGDAGADVAALIDRLGNRLGPAGVVRIESRASHMPERASREVSAASRRAPPVGTPPAPRPVHLLPAPEPIEVVAPIPDHPPVMFRWRRVQHRVARADGPERIGPEWWLEAPADMFNGEARGRDYYRIEDSDGVRFWVYRDGPYRPDTPPRWYLHGFFP